MFKLFVFTLLMLFVLYQPYGADASAKGAAKKALRSLMKKIDKVTTQAEKAGDMALDILKEEATDLNGDTIANLEKALKPIKKIRDELVAKAKAKGLDVTECRNYLDDFMKTRVNLTQNLIDCTSQEISTGENLVKDVLNRIKIINYDLSTLDADIDKCHGSRVKKAKCYADINEEIVKITQTVPTSILADMAQATFLVTCLIPNLQECSVEQLAQARKQAAKDLEDFATCVTYCAT